MLARTKMTELNPYKENSLYSIMELSLNFVNVIRFIEGLGDKGGNAEGGKVSTKEPISLEEMAKIERQIGNLRSVAIHAQPADHQYPADGGEPPRIFRSLYFGKNP